jgi:hypothetical protein
MANSRHYLRGVQVEEPRNWKDLEITMDWTKEKVDATINLDSLEYAGDTGKMIIDFLQNNSFFEGQKYRIEVGEPLNPVLTFNGYLDATDNPEIKAPNIVQIALRREQGEDWITEVADSFSFRFLASQEYNGAGKITAQDYKKVPYVRNFIPNGTELLLLSISTFLLVKETVDNVRSLANQTTELIKGVTPVQGTAGPIPVIAFSIGQIIGAIINLAVTLAYTIGVIFAIVELIKDIIEQLAPVKRFHLGMSIKDLASKACEYLGLTLESDLLDSLNTAANTWVIIPSKGHKGGEPPSGVPVGEFIELGVPKGSDGLDTFGDLIRFIRTTWNADYQLKDGVFRIDRKDFKQDTASYQIPDTLTNQDDLRNEYKPNTNEIKANYFLVWDTDEQDQNTLDNQNGRTYQAITTVKNVTNQELVNIKGLTRVSIPLSMATRKNELTTIEEILKGFLEAADFFTGENFAGQFAARVGAMHLSSHFLSRPKMVVLAGNQLAKNQRYLLSAQRLWEGYHFLESFVTIDNVNNQQIIVTDKKIPFCFQDFVSLSNNNFCTANGERAEVMSLAWKVEENTAVITYRVYRVYDTNLDIKFLSE